MAKYGDGGVPAAIAAPHRWRLRDLYISVSDLSPNVVARQLEGHFAVREQSPASLIDGTFQFTPGPWNMPWAVYQARTRDSTSGSVATSP